MYIHTHQLKSRDRTENNNRVFVTFNEFIISWHANYQRHFDILFLFVPHGGLYRAIRCDHFMCNFTLINCGQTWKAHANRVIWIKTSHNHIKREIEKVSKSNPLPGPLTMNHSPTVQFHFHLLHDHTHYISQKPQHPIPQSHTYTQSHILIYVL